jgi:Cellulase (glycosyl hydrolase family 5)
MRQTFARSKGAAENVESSSLTDFVIRVYGQASSASGSDSSGRRRRSRSFRSADMVNATMWSSFFKFLIVVVVGLTTVARAEPLPARMMNVVSWGEGPDRHWTVQSAYLSDGWTPELMKLRLGEQGIDTLRVAWSDAIVADGLQSRWFQDIRALSGAGFKLVITCHTHIAGGGGRFSHYASSREGDLPIAERNANNAPTWTKFIADWRMIVEQFQDDPNVIGYEPFNEYAPSGKSTPPGRLLMRDFGGWLDAMSPLIFEKGKHVWIEAPWATTSFGVLAGQRDDADRLLSEIVATHHGRVHPAIHVYNWYGKGYRRPESFEQVRDALSDKSLPAELKPLLQAIIDEPDADRQRRMIAQYNFDQRFDSTRRLIDDARRVCGLGPERQVWMSEAGLNTRAFTGDERMDEISAIHFRAIVRACNAGNTSIAFWLDRGKPDAWGFFSRHAQTPIDAHRREMHAAFADRSTERLDLVGGR